MAKFKPIRIGDTVPLQQIQPATEEVDGKLYVSQSGVVLGRASAGDGPHEEILFEDLPGGPGGASYTEITYADMQTALSGGTLTPGGWYLITDATGTDLGFLTYAVTENQISVAGVGGYLNADFQAVGNYDGVEAITGIAAGTQQGIWIAANEVEYSEGDVVIWNLLHWQLTDDTLLDGTDPATNTAAYTQLLKTDADQGYITAWDVSEFDFSNQWLQYRADLRGNAARYSYIFDVTGLGLGYSGILDFKFGDDSTYLNVVDSSYVGIKNNPCIFRYNNLFNYSSISDISTDESSEISFNILNLGTIARVILGVSSQMSYNNLSINSTIADINIGEARLINNTMYQDSRISDLTILSGGVENNILENGASLTGITAGANCSISRNKIGQGAIIGLDTTMGDACEITDNVTGPTCEITYNTLGDGGRIVGNNLIVNAYIYEMILIGGGEVLNNTLLAESEISASTLINSVISENTLQPAAAITSMNIDENFVVKNVFFQANSRFQGITTEGTGSIQDIAMSAGAKIQNKVFSSASLISKSIFSVIDESETIAESITGNIAQPGFSDIPGTIDITGITTLDCTAAWAQYRGIYNLTSSNATEAIDTITNPPTAFPFTLRPDDALTLTITGTAYSGIAAGQIALKAASYVLDGSKGEYIVLEIDPLGSGCLVEKYVVNGII